MDLAQKHFHMSLDVPAPEELQALARNGLSEIVVRGLKSRGLRMDGSLLSAGRHAAPSPASRWRRQPF